MTPRTIPVTVTVETTREIPEDVDTTITTARQLQRDGDAMIGEARRLIRDTAKRLTRQGWTQNDISHVLGVSKQRVSQLVNPPEADR